MADWAGSEDEVKAVIADWIAVEEALVGGLVRLLLPAFRDSQMSRLPIGMIKEDIEKKKEFVRYRYLEKGIALVKAMGCAQTIALYQSQPENFRERIIN